VTPAALTVTDVEQVIAQGVAEAQARNTQATIAVVDRVGNVLAVYRMGAAAQRGVIIATSLDANGNALIHGGLEGIRLPTPAAPVNIDDQTAISKAITGAYLSSDGNAFSTRTASQIVQENFNPGQQLQPSGPLFGVQFSQLPCSDFNTAASGAAGTTNAGPHRSPLGFSADSGGLPVYKNGILAGGIGVMTKSTYSDNLTPLVGIPIDDDEVVALAGSTGYQAPSSLDADNIAVNGLTLQYTDATSANFAAPVSASGVFTPLPVGGFFAGPAAGHTAIAGLTYDSSDGASGIAPDGALGPTLYPGTT
jgi:uncharacterized protein GlcG (DUF336 family)